MDSLSKRIIRATLQLRNAAYKVIERRNTCDSIPFGGSIRESIGPFPEFILKGRYCKRSLKGLCSPCFYSRIPGCDVSDADYDESYEKQVQYIVDNFHEKVVLNEIGRVSHTFSSQVPVYGIVCTPTGSYFDENEYPLSVRIRNLKRLVAVSEAQNCEIVLHIESHADDIITYFSSASEDEIALLHRLHARILLGFESVDAFTRNVLYSKSLSLENFEKAVSLLKAEGFAVGAFVFAGLFAMTEEETKKDVHASLMYLKNLEVSPVLMFANTQEYTIPDVLLSRGEYKLLDPRTVCEIVEETIDLFGCSADNNIDPWFIADPVGGPPEPNYHLFNASSSTVCKSCSSKIYNAIERLRITKDRGAFDRALETVKKCDCSMYYQELLEKQRINSASESLEERAEKRIALVERYAENYILQKSPWLVKAELLCYGLRLSDEQKKVISKTNPFICEKGFVNASHIKYRGTLINVCVADDFCNASPYSLNYLEDGWELCKNNISLGIIEFLDFPEWVLATVNGIRIGDVLRPHSNRCISIWPSTTCVYMDNGEGCRFCCLSSNGGRILSVDTVVKMLSVALDYNPQYEINISGGTCGSPKQAIEYLSTIAQKVTDRYPETTISVECAPPASLSDLEKLKNSGVGAIVMNLEIYDSDIRKTICPGKGKIEKQQYYDMLKKSVELFGKGNVSSVLIVGVQPNRDVVRGAQELIELGVIPTLIPIKPIDDSLLRSHPVTNADEYVNISKRVSEMMRDNLLTIEERSGCAACGACSLEIDLGGKRHEDFDY